MKNLEKPKKFVCLGKVLVNFGVSIIKCSDSAQANTAQRDKGVGTGYEEWGKGVNKGRIVRWGEG